MKLIPHSKEAVDRFFLHVQPSIIAAPSCKTFGRQLLSHDRIFTIPIGNYTQLLGRAGIHKFAADIRLRHLYQKLYLKCYIQDLLPSAHTGGKEEKKKKRIGVIVVCEKGVDRAGIADKRRVPIFSRFFLPQWGIVLFFPVVLNLFLCNS